jgi:O-antigen ligase
LKTPFRETTARAIDAIVFYSLLAVIALAAIPYGTVEPWWKSLFQSLVFVLAAVSIVAKLLAGDSIVNRHSLSNYQLFWPLLALIVFAFLQTVPLPFVVSGNSSGTTNSATLSADPFQTRRFIVHLFALLAVGWLLVTHTTNRKRLRHLVELVIAVATVTAVFGLWRHASQRGPGFVLPHLLAGYGYAQFINSNHFAFLMEMALGLALGIVVCRGVTGKRLAIYLVAAVPMWIALVLSNSRGGILSLLCQVLFLALLYGVGSEPSATGERGSRAGGAWSRADSGENFARRLFRISRSFAARAVLIAALLAGAITTVVMVGGDPLAGRVDSIAVELDRKTADFYTLRPSIWRATWDLIKDHPLAGVGFGGYWIAITKYHAASGETTPQEAHNDYLELLASGGVIGVAIGIWFVVTLIRTARRKLRATDHYQRAVTLGALAGILSIAVHSLVDFGLHITINALVFTVLIAIVVMNVQMTKQTAN